MASLTLLQSVSSAEKEMESLSRNSSYGPSSPLDLRKLRKSPTIELLNDEKMKTTKTSSLVSLIARSMKLASLPRLSIGSLFDKDETQDENKILGEDSDQADAADEEFEFNRDSSPNYENYEAEDGPDGSQEDQENAEAEIPTVAEASQSEDEIQNYDGVADENAEVEAEDVMQDDKQDEVHADVNDDDADVNEENAGENEENTNENEDEMNESGKDDTNDNESADEQMEEAEENNEDENEMRAENDVPMSEDDQSIYRGPPPMEVVITFDTTGSMSSILDPLRANITNVCERLFADVPNLRIAVVAHGDYCDEHEFYLMKAVDFTQDFGALRTFLNETEGTGGGDFPECYEYVLNRVGQLSWTPGTKRALIMIGDAVPHEVGSPDNKLGLDWRQEVSKLYHQMGISVYSVQCKEEEGAETFWRELAERASGRYLQLSEFDNVVQLIMAICYREKDPMMFGAFEHEVRHKVGPYINKDLHNMFEVLRDGPSTSASFTPDDGAVPGPSGAPVMRAGKRKRNADVADSDVASPAKKIRKPPVKAAKRGALKVSDFVKRAKGAVKRKVLSKPLARERVPGTRFMLGTQEWSTWKEAFAAKKVNASWLPCRKGKAGYRNGKLFLNDNRSPAVYEFAVQPADGRKRYPVYLRATTGFSNSLRWDTYFFRNKTMLNLVEGALNNGHKVFVRRLIVKRPLEIESEPGKVMRTEKVRFIAEMLFKEYDYAWNINVYAGSGARPLKF